MASGQYLLLNQREYAKRWTTSAYGSNLTLAKNRWTKDSSEYVSGTCYTIWDPGTDCLGKIWEVEFDLPYSESNNT
jgi:hypothetical protein